jgi:hypothetical protein
MRGAVMASRSCRTHARQAKREDLLVCLLLCLLVWYQELYNKFTGKFALGCQAARQNIAMQQAKGRGRIAVWVQEL